MAGMAGKGRGIWYHRCIRLMSVKGGEVIGTCVTVGKDVARTREWRR